jgi:hypothetical protein
MSHVTGVITGLFDNRLKNGQPSPFPNWKIMIGDNEFTAWTANNLPCKKGDNVSIQFGVSKKTGKPFVSSDYETKELKLQVIPAGQATTTPIVASDEIPLDDNLSNYVPDDFANNGVVDNSPTSFAYGANAKPAVNTDKKGLEMFCMACVKSALESNQLKADRQSIQSFINDMKEIYKASF